MKLVRALRVKRGERQNEQSHYLFHRGAKEQGNRAHHSAHDSCDGVPPSLESSSVDVKSGQNPALPHRREIRGTHVHLVHPITLVHPLYELGGLFPILWKGRVGMERVPILLRFVPAGMSHEVDEGVGPSRIIVGYPVADDMEIVLG